MAPTPFVRKWLDHINKQGWVIERKKGWIDDLRFLTETRDQFGSVPEKVPLFWIRLRGVVGELRTEAHEQFATMQWARDGVADAAARGERFDRIYGFMESVVKTHDALRNALDENEAVVVDFMRHVHAHPFVDSYRYQLRPKGEGLETEYKPRLLDKKYDRETLLLIIERKLDDHGGEEGAARALAAKIEPQVLAVWTASQPMFEAD